MKPRILSLTFALSAATAIAVAPALTGCSADPSEKLVGALGGGGAMPRPNPDESLAAGSNTHHHPARSPSGENGVTDPAEVNALRQEVATPEVVARLHGCTKITYAALGAILRSRGVTMQGAQGQ